MTNRLVLLVDGPRAGELMPVPELALAWEVMPPFGPGALEMPLPNPVLYRFKRFHIVDRIIELGWSGPEPEPPFEALAAHLLSDGARKAMR